MEGLSESALGLCRLVRAFLPLFLPAVAGLGRSLAGRPSGPSIRNLVDMALMFNCLREHCLQPVGNNVVEKAHARFGGAHGERVLPPQSILVRERCSSRARRRRVTGPKRGRRGPSSPCGPSRQSCRSRVIRPACSRRGSRDGRVESRVRAGRHGGSWPLRRVRSRPTSWGVPVAAAVEAAERARRAPRTAPPRRSIPGG